MAENGTALFIFGVERDLGARKCRLIMHMIEKAKCEILQMQEASCSQLHKMVQGLIYRKIQKSGNIPDEYLSKCVALTRSQESSFEEKWKEVLKDAMQLIPDEWNFKERVNVHAYVMLMIEKTKSTIPQNSIKCSQLRDMVEELIDQRPMICLKTKGDISIMMNKEKACQESIFIKTALSSCMNRSEDTRVTEIRMESDDPELLKIVAVAVLIGERKLGDFKLPSISCASAYALMELSTRMCIPWMCCYASSLIKKSRNIPYELLQQCLALAELQNSTCEEEIKPCWNQALRFALAKEAAVISSGAAPKHFSRDISISHLKQIFECAQPEDNPKFTVAKLPATGGTVASGNGFNLRVTVDQKSQTVSAVLMISRENTRAHLLDRTEQLGHFSYEITVTPTYGTPDSLAGPADRCRRTAAVDPRLVSKSKAHEESQICGTVSCECKLQAGAKPTGYDVRFRAHMSQEQIRALILVNYALDASEAGYDGSCSPIIAALRFFRCLSNAQGEGVEAQAEGAKRIWEDCLCSYVARILHLRHSGHILQNCAARDRLLEEARAYEMAASRRKRRRLSHSSECDSDSSRDSDDADSGRRRPRARARAGC